MNLCVVSHRSHPEDVSPNIVMPFTESSPSILEIAKLNLATQGFHPRLIRMERDFSYDLLFRKLWEAGRPFILVEHDILPWPGALVELWNCPQPWCGFQYYVFGELRSYLGCTKFNPGVLGECPLEGDLLEWQKIDKAIQRKLLTRGQNGHIHGPPVTHLNINHARMRENLMVNPSFWGSDVPL